MGLFDYVLVEVPVEGIADPSAIEWQTKEFDWPYMEKYKITAEGRLLHEVVHYEDLSNPFAPEGSWERFAGCQTPVHEWWRDTEYHGDLEMCACIAPDYPHYVARFTHGQLESIKVNRPDRPHTGTPE
jgi:hypothetical protein